MPKIKDKERSNAPLYRRIAEELRKAIEEGRMRAGDRLPSERSLQTRYHCSRSTVQTAYDELASAGYLERIPARGTFVAAGPRGSRVHGETSDILRRSVKPFDNPLLTDLMTSSVTARYDFESARPDADLFPVETMKLVFHEIMARHTGDLLAYAPVAGLSDLRTAIVTHLLPLRGMRGVPPDAVLVTSGAVQGLDLITQMLVAPKDVVITESPTFPGALERFLVQGAQVVGIPLDDEGLALDPLREAVRRYRPKLLYVQPTYQNPTGLTWSARRRRQVLDVASDYHLPVVEDDAYGFLAPHEPALKAEDREGMVLHLGSFSKLLAPGLRLGYVVAPPDVVRALALAKQHTDLYTNTVSQLLVEGWLSLERLAAFMEHRRTFYAERLREALLTLDMTPLVRPVRRPTGGFYVYCQYHGVGDVTALRRVAQKNGVTFALGHNFTPDGGEHQCLRICTSALDTAHIRLGLQRLARVADELGAQSPPTLPGR